jgi:hypothetical protein
MIRLFSTVKKSSKYDINSMTWVLTLMDKKRLGLSENQIADLHGHSGFSWSWTNQQVKIIEDKGFDYWIKKTDGPKGFAYFLDKSRMFK